MSGSLRRSVGLAPVGVGPPSRAPSPPALPQPIFWPGGKTIIITLTGDTWIAAGAGSFDLQRDEILQGLDSAQGEALGWNAKVRDLEVVTAVVRTSDTVVTITLTASVTYDITAQETITVTIPSTALVTGPTDITATPTFTVDVVGGEPEGSLLGGKLIRGGLLQHGVLVRR